MTFRTKRLWMQNHVVNTNENNCYYNIFLQKRSHGSKPNIQYFYIDVYIL